MPSGGTEPLHSHNRVRTKSRQKMLWSAPPDLGGERYKRHGLFLSNFFLAIFQYVHRNTATGTLLLVAGVDVACSKQSWRRREP